MLVCAWRRIIVIRNQDAAAVVCDELLDLWAETFLVSDELGLKSVHRKLKCILSFLLDILNSAHTLADDEIIVNLCSSKLRTFSCVSSLMVKDLPG